MTIILELGPPSYATKEQLQSYENMKLENVNMVDEISDAHTNSLSELLNCLNTQGLCSEICTFLLNDLKKN